MNGNTLMIDYDRAWAIVDRLRGLNAYQAYYVKDEVDRPTAPGANQFRTIGGPPGGGTRRPHSPTRRRTPHEARIDPLL